MSRYSPTVLEQPFDLGGIINQMMEGYYGGRQMKRETRSRKRQEEREMVSRCSRRRRTVTQVRATGGTGRKYSAASSLLQALSSISLAMTREAVQPRLQGIHHRLEARKDLAIAKVAPKLVGVEDVAEVEEILGELRDEMLDELDAIETETAERGTRQDDGRRSWCDGNRDCLLTGGCP